MDQLVDDFLRGDGPFDAIGPFDWPALTALLGLIATVLLLVVTTKALRANQAMARDASVSAQASSRAAEAAVLATQIAESALALRFEASMYVMTLSSPLRVNLGRADSFPETLSRDEGFITWPYLTVRGGAVFIHDVQIFDTLERFRGEEIYRFIVKDPHAMAGQHVAPYRQSDNGKTSWPVRILPEQEQMLSTHNPGSDTYFSSEEVLRRLLGTTILVVSYSTTLDGERWIIEVPWSYPDSDNTSLKSASAH